MSPYDVDRGSTGVINSFAGEKVNKYLSAGVKVRLKHYNINEYLMAETIEASDFSLKLKISDRMSYANVLPGDHVLISFIFQEEYECIIKGVVENAHAEYPQWISIKAARVEKYRNERKSRRYAINVCCNILDQDSLHFAIAKNISFSGIKLVSKAAVENKKNVRLEMFFDEGRNISINAGIVREKQFLNFTEYGLVMQGMDQEKKQKLDDIINYLISLES